MQLEFTDNGQAEGLMKDIRLSRALWQAGKWRKVQKINVPAQIQVLIVKFWVCKELAEERIGIVAAAQELSPLPGFLSFQPH